MGHGPPNAARLGIANGLGPEGLIDNWTDGPKPRLSADNWLVCADREAGPDREKDGVVRGVARPQARHRQRFA